ncbi:MAG TPA: ATP-binding protein [Polyangia bacterium]|jgi:signal transduction histidine kinase|nr:ATP-binding protein [Polyangia bacterium]
MNLRTKLLLAQVPLIAGLIALGVTGRAATTTLGRSSELILKDNYRSVLAAERMKEAIERIDSASLFLVAGRAARAQAQLDDNCRRFEAELAVQEGNITEPGEIESTRRLRERWTAYRGALDRFQSRPAGERADAYFTGLEPLFLGVKGAADEVLSINQDAMVAKSERARRTAHRLDLVMLTATLLVALLGVAASSVVTTRLLRPLGVLGQAVRRLGEGDPEARAVLAGRDEIALLAREFNTMADRLDQYRRSSLGELLQTQQEAQSAIDSLPDPVVILGVGPGDVRNVNQAAESLLRLRVGANGGAAADPAIRDMLERVRDHVARGRGPWAPRSLDEAVRVVLPDGERRLLPRATPLYGEAGEVAGVTVMLEDVTRLHRLDELKNDLVATVAHEFRTPLTSLRMAIHLCVEQVVGPLTAKQEELLHAAREDCERLQAIIDDLLDLSRIQAGRMVLDRRAVEVAALVEAVLEAQRGAAAERNLTLAAEGLAERDAGLVDADAERAQLVLGNLLGNALRYTPAGGRVVVRVEPGEKSVRFLVSDTGPGIAREYHEAIFEKFFRLPGQQGGAGLGLYIVKELVQAHGGQVGVESDAGQGSLFWFTLPRPREAP